RPATQRPEHEGVLVLFHTLHPALVRRFWCSIDSCISQTVYPVYPFEFACCLLCSRRMRGMKSVKAAVLCGLVVSAGLQAAPVLTNGSLTGPITNGGVPPGWTLLAGSPDTMDQNNNVGVSGLGQFVAAPAT